MNTQNNVAKQRKGHNKSFLFLVGLMDDLKSLGELQKCCLFIGL